MQQNHFINHQYFIMKIVNKFLLIVSVLLALACNNDDYAADSPADKQIQLVVNARGTVLGQSKTITQPESGEILEPVCFLMELVDPDTGKVIGTLEDCVVSSETPSDGTITSRVITSINIDGRGTIQSENLVLQTIQPPVEEFNFKTSFTPTEDNVIHTTFEFEGMKGTVSLDGEVNLRHLEEGIATFNCYFTIDLISF